MTTTGLSIGEAAKATGLSEDTLRYYERIGLTPRVGREPSGHRRYSPEDLLWLTFVSRMRETGMAIEPLLRYATLLREGDATAEERRVLLEEHAASVEAKIAQLRECLDLIRWKLGRMDGPAC